MKKYIFYIVAASIICFNYSCEKNGEININSADALHKKLETAFQSSSTSNLEQFFINWNKTISSNTVQNDFVETIYEVYKEFYSPFDLTKLGDWEWGNSLNSNSKYAVVQNKIYYAIVEKDVFDTWNNLEELDSINDFRPTLNLEKSEILYLLPEYEKALNLFLGTETNDGNWKRYEFIRPYIPILHGHWGGYWHLSTHPEVSLILLDTSKSVAKILFRVGYQGGETILEKNNNKWIITESRATWIE
ncbi:hypothetical protein LJC25_02345 [Bacteroidales bacterium OttesenSCG-928-K03]|nr:hypothetical protein [Odoribacter sp. OttesenSCG-928-L07]MDL2239588.1 hypothetical protein [Bacteroidales bacterium OttesenSCG-928-L14]MDL2242550.1 hypothetical protein [Bacteroidales bacterium OttesenSCG-928-K03]